MRTFTIIATRWQTGRVSFEMTVRITVQADSLSDAYRAIRKQPEFRGAHLSKPQ